MWIWIQAMLGIVFISVGIAIVAVIIAFVVQLFDKNMKE
jgi:hypothetical protein